jgi:hypothetical protein
MNWSSFLNWRTIEERGWRNRSIVLSGSVFIFLGSAATARQLAPVDLLFCGAMLLFVVGAEMHGGEWQKFPDNLR